MAEIDYVFVAEYAKVDSNGLLTAVGASFTFLTADLLPAAHRLAVAGRIRARVDEGPVPLRIAVRGPNGSFEIAATAELEPGPAARPYADGRIGHLFALDMQIPLPSEGLYEVGVAVGDPLGAERVVKFEVESAKR